MSVNRAEMKFFQDLAQQASSQPAIPFDQITIHEFRKACEFINNYSGETADVNSLDKNVTLRDGYKIPIRIYNSDITTKGPVLIMFPGCGYIQDFFESNAISCSRIAKYSGIKCIMGNFRLAPEHLLPIPMYDGYDIVKYVADHADELNIDKNKIFVGGMSSGAHCAAVISELAYQKNEFKVFHQILLNGAYDLAESNHDYVIYEKEDQICKRADGISNYIYKLWGIEESQYKDPLFSPYYSKNLAHLANATVIVGEYDGLRSDSEAFYLQLKQQGNKCRKIVLDGQTHNTYIMRQAMSDGIDPAEVISNVIKENC